MEAEPIEKKEIQNINNIDFNYITVNGLNLYTYISKPSAKKAYYKIEFNIVEEISQIECVNCGSPVKVLIPHYFVYSFALSSFPVVGLYNRNLESSGLLKIYSGYLEGFPNNPFGFWEGSTYWMEHVLVGWIVTCRLYSISEEAFRFYKLQQELLTTKTNIFAPNPTQIHGNVVCVSDPSKLALGFFQVSRRIGRTYFATQKRGVNNPELVDLGEELTFFPADGEWVKVKPQYWIEF